MSDPIQEFILIHAPHLASDVSEDTPLFEEGLLDSLGLMKLVAFLERKYQLIVPEEQITPESFRDFHSIRNLLQSLTNAK
ncbi:MAG TPA: acyl carrier protein [Bryobacteraceae bacterium]|nr:acyl carrier protein [Bryobacteraceae bacterium]